MAVPQELPVRSDRAEEREDLVPHFVKKCFEAECVADRRRWIERRTGGSMTHVGSYSIASGEMRGNIESPVGAVQVPVGLAGPLLIHGEHARGVFYVPLATTEGALVRSYERGMTACTRAGGVSVRVTCDENRVSPVFLFSDVAAACEFTVRVNESFDEIRAEAEATTGHGRLLRLHRPPGGPPGILHFCYFTRDAPPTNINLKDPEHPCHQILRHIQR